MYSYIINFRNTFMSLIRNINLFEINNQVINNKFILFFVNLFFIFPVKYIFKYSKINYLYKIDSVYFYENYNQNINSIYPVILKFKLLDIHDNKILNENNIIDKIKMYNFNVPIKIFCINENIDITKYNTIIIKTLKSKTDKIYNIDETINYTISDFL
jgi:hypothetical protein